jgi:CDP-glycerol glycerophosphotransferase (TagB/SpsB family)
MEAILINRKLSRKEEAEILSELSAGKKYDIFSNVEVSDELQPFIRGIFELSPEEKKKINYEIFERVLQFGEIKIDGTAITDLLMVGKASIWHYHKFRTYFQIRNLFFEIRLIEKLKLKYAGLICYTSNKEELGYKFGDPQPTIKLQKTNPQKLNYTSVFSYLIFFLFRIIRGSTSLKLRNRKHLIIDHAIKQSIIDINSLKEKEGNVYLDYLYNLTGNEFSILDDVEIPKFSGKKFRMLKSHFVKNRIYGESILISGLLSAKVKANWKQGSNQLLEAYEVLRNANFSNEDKMIAEFIISLHSTSKLYLYKYYSFQHFFKKSSFKTVTSIDENSLRIKSILDAAKHENIKTVGVQHGTIHDLHPAYVFTEEDARRGIQQDQTLVWGDHWASFLIHKGNYNKSAITVTGQIRTDIIPKLKTTNRTDYLQIDALKKIIVFASQPQRDPILREKSALDVFTAVKDLKDAELILKLHPAERNDFDYYKAIARKAKCTNYRIVLDFDLYLLISISDIIITCFSTVGAETVYFNKPLIILDHLKQDIQKYHEEGIAFQTSNSQELNAILVKLLEGKIDFNEEAYQNYIQQYAFRIDGKVAERAKDCIMRF